VAVVGFRDSVTGDTLLQSKSFAESLKDVAALPGVEVPDPVSLWLTSFLPVLCTVNIQEFECPIF
jgi:hypothetical protein